MRRQTQTLLYHLLPIVFWLLAIGGSVLFYRTWEGYVVAILALICMYLITHIKRHASSVEECFEVGVLLSIAAYWLPSVLFLILPVWVYLIYKNLFSFRSFLASLIGCALVAIWVVVGNLFQLSTFNFQLSTFNFSLSANLFAWIPAGSFLLAWLGTTIVQQTLRER